jgi:hypothetical protein
MSEETRRIDRRTVLAATAGLAGFAGCSGGGSETETTADETTTAENATGGPGTATPAPPASDSSTTPSSDPTACPSLSRPYRSFEEGGLLPLSFEYPSVMDDTIGYRSPDDPDSNQVDALVQKGDPDRQGDGDISFAIGADLLPKLTEGEVERFYDRRSNLDTITTVDINGQSVEFLFADLESRSYDTDLSGYSALALVPYQWSNPDDVPDENGYSYHTLSLVYEVVLFATDQQRVSSSCSDNLRAALEATIESLSVQNGTQVFEDRVSELSSGVR